MPNRIDIDERPSIVDARTRIGDWEVDLVIVVKEAFH
jgi:IS30 family transposase